MRSATLWVGVVLVVCGCASRQNDPTAGVSRSAAPLNYETTVTNYFDITTRVPPAQRKLQFGPPETTNCRILASSGGHLGWVVPVMFETSAPPTPPVAAAVAPSKVDAPAQTAKAAPLPRGKAAANTRTAKGATVAPATAAASPTTTTTIAAVGAGPDGPLAKLDNVSVTGKTRYFFWFDRETINAVTKRVDICP